jgi:hypothetical protein
MAQWANVKAFSEPMFTNADEALLTDATAAIENAYVNEAKGQSRFPFRRPFSTLTGHRTYLTEWRGNMIAATSDGKVFRINEAGVAKDVTGVPISGGRRVVFAATDDELLIAAGGPILRLASDRTEVLSEDAPYSSHVAYIDGYVIGIENYSGRWWYSEPGQFRVWPDLNFFAAEAKPDNVNACVVTPYRELLVAGVDSIEQFERLPDGDRPFFRRWATGDGVYAPYTLVADKAGTFCVNRLGEFNRVNGQLVRPESDDIGFSLEKIDDWTDAWAQAMHIRGQKFIVLQMPFATNAYGTKGLTFLFDYRGRRWSFLYDQQDGIPVRWAPWSYLKIFNRHFVGVPGGVEELMPDDFSSNTAGQRMLVRTGHIDEFGPSRLDGIRLRFKRGVKEGARLGLRISRNDGPWGRWLWAPFGGAGDRHMVVQFLMSFGEAETWRFEYQVTDNCPVEFVGAQMLIERLEH